MKILRSKGQSYTALESESEGKAPTLSRGLRLTADKQLTPQAYRETGLVPPRRLADYVGEDCALILRQTISVLDKVIRKPRTLRAFELQAYIERTLLARALWELVRSRVEPEIRQLPDGEEAFKELKASWDAKVHPYARFQVDQTNPANDENAKSIVRQGHPRKDCEAEVNAPKTRDCFNGRWHKALWRTTPSGQPDYEAIATAIWSHLFTQEMKIDGKERTEIDDHERRLINGEEEATFDGEERTRIDDRQARPTGRGLIEARGLAISGSVSDPREWSHDPTAYSKDDEDLYFQHDVAKQILNAVISGLPGPIYPSAFGKILYIHFKPVLEEMNLRDLEKSDRQRIWTLHNSIRQFYQKLAKSERFRLACSDGAGRLRALLPHDKDDLLRVLGVRRRNADMSALIRLGKLVAHASDLPFDVEDPQVAFDSRMETLVTSAGQSEIKRNEAFTRVWRTSVALSLRTLQVWVDPMLKKAADQDKAGGHKDDRSTDLTAPDVAVKLAGRHYDDVTFQRQLPLIFGDRAIALHNGKSRASLVRTTPVSGRKELLWALLRLASEIRHRTNHFNTKQRLVDLIAGGVLQEAVPPRPIGQRKVDAVDAGALSLFDQLLLFDKALQKQVVADELNRLAVPKYAGERLPALLAELSPARDNSDLSPPRFMAVLRQANNIAQNHPSAAPACVKPFATLDIKYLTLAQQESNTARGPNQFRIGILRLLYGNGFLSWLDSRLRDGAFVRQAVEAVVDGKKARIEDFNKETSHIYFAANTLADELDLGSATIATDLFNALTARSMSDERIRHSYRARPNDQRERAGQVEEFKRDLFAYLFGSYLDARGLAWIWDVQGADGDEEPFKPVAPDDIDIGGWKTDPWHSQFYAWLYLIPSDQVSLLRHQFRRTSVLEGKGNEQADAVLIGKLKDMERLMGLYTAVQSAGFGGREHEGGLKLRTLFYEDADQFERVYSGDPETDDMSIRGTRRGLRQILRFGHFGVLESIYDKHRVTKEEVDALTRLQSGAVSDRFAERLRLHQQIVTLCNERKPDVGKLEQLCTAYKNAAVETADYVFQMNSARLAEHARLHALMMRVIGRLADFTLMWERDRTYVLLGFLYMKLSCCRFSGHDPKLTPAVFRTPWG